MIIVNEQMPRDKLFPGTKREPFRSTLTKQETKSSEIEERHDSRHVRTCAQRCVRVRDVTIRGRCPGCPSIPARSEHANIARRYETISRSSPLSLPLSLSLSTSARACVCVLARKVARFVREKTVYRTGYTSVRLSEPVASLWARTLIRDVIPQVLLRVSSDLQFKSGSDHALKRLATRACNGRSFTGTMHGRDFILSRTKRKRRDYYARFYLVQVRAPSLLPFPLFLPLLSFFSFFFFSREVSGTAEERGALARSAKRIVRRAIFVDLRIFNDR